MITVAIVLLAGLSGSVLSAQAVFTPDRSSPAGSRRYAPALVVAIDPQARTITVRSRGVGKDETFPVEAQALRRAGALAPGQQVVLTLRAVGAGRPEVVTRIDRPVRGVRARPAPPKRVTVPANSGWEVGNEARLARSSRVTWVGLVVVLLPDCQPT